MLAAADHLRDGIQATEDGCQRPVVDPDGKRPLDPVEQLPAPGHVPVDHREGEVFLAAEVMEEAPVVTPAPCRISSSLVSW